MARPTNPVLRLRTATLIEGVSFLLLLCIAMPLKYLADLPAAVKLVGWLHGLLFIAVCAALVHTTIAARWPLTRAALILVAALLPFGPFVMDRQMKRFAQEFDERAAAGAITATTTT
jgi:integral membrane protein